MDSVTNRHLSQHLPFQELTDFDIGISFQSARERITELMDQHGLVEFLKGNYLSEFLLYKFAIQEFYFLNIIYILLYTDLI